MSGSQGQVRAALRARLEARRGEIEEALLARVYAIAEPGDVDPGYLHGLNESIAVALDYALEAIERGEARAPGPPPALRAQARMAARNGIGLDTVLRRYLAGYSLLGDFIAKEAEGDDLPQGSSLRELLQGGAAIFDRLVAAISEEHARESASKRFSSEAHREERVDRLLAGEPVDVSDLGYDFDAGHIALVASGPQSAAVIREWAAVLECRVLLIVRGGKVVWAWFGARRPLDRERLDRLATAWSKERREPIALGEPGEGISGWRLSHRQAQAAYPIALRCRDAPVRYGDVPILASTSKDSLAVTSLRRLFLDPLHDEKDSGATARDTLRAYFAADRNLSAAAAVLGVTPRTVGNRLRAIEARLGRPLVVIATGVEVALALDELEADRAESLDVP